MPQSVSWLLGNKFTEQSPPLWSPDRAVGLDALGLALRCCAGFLDLNTPSPGARVLQWWRMLKIVSEQSLCPGKSLSLFS